MAKLDPLRLSANFGQIADERAATTAAGTDCIGAGVVIGDFVGAIRVGPLVTRAVHDATALQDCAT